MKNTFYKVVPFFRTVLTLLAIAIISFKTIAAVITSMGFKKDLVAIEKTTDTEEKKSETDDKAEKEKEFLGVGLLTLNHPTIATIVAHCTTYYMPRSSSFFKTIIIPPPDFLFT